jgi:hypothetical protein
MSAPKVGEVTDDVSLIGRRDAFHVPGILVQSDYNIPAGMKVRFTDKTCTKVVPMYKEDFYTYVEDDEGNETDEEVRLPAHAVADPFKPYCKREQLFWVFPMPGTVNDLTHSFNFDLEKVTELSESELDLIRSAADDEEGYQSCKGCYS